MSMEEYKKKMLDEEIERKILKSEEDYNNGRVRKAEDVFKEWELMKKQDIKVLLFIYKETLTLL